MRASKLSAGDAGRGFAVVASEVRALAQRSSDAARQIKNLIGESTGQVARGVVLVSKAGDALTAIADRVAHISTLITAIASGAQEQSTGLGEINIGVTHLDQVTQQNAAMVEEATAGSHALNHEATQLIEFVSRFEVKDTAADIARSTVGRPPARAAEKNRTQRSSSKDTFTPKAMSKARKVVETGMTFELHDCQRYGTLQDCGQDHENPPRPPITDATITVSGSPRRRVGDQCYLRGK